VSALSELRLLAESAPSRHLPWLPLQMEFLDDPATIKLIRAGNQYFGKTAALCEEMRRRLEGCHPDPAMHYPRRMLCISPSAPQSVSIQRKLWEVLDKSLLDPRTQFDPVIGFRGRHPAVRMQDGSVLLFKSGRAGAISFAGETVDDVFIDEPTTLRVYLEATRRVAIRGGYVIMGMTPINASEPLTWCKDLVHEGIISEHHATLTPDQMVPVGHDEPRRTAQGHVIDAEYIERERRSMPGHEAAIILDGEWETPIEGRVFVAFDSRPGGQHVVEQLPEGISFESIFIGIDHGERDHKQCAVLVGVVGGGEYPQVWVLDEYSGQGLTTPEDDAEGILAMLGRWGWGWDDLTQATGDKPHDVRRITASVARKSNADLAVAISRRLNRPGGACRIRQAKTGRGSGRGSVDRGVRWLHTLMLRPDCFRVHVQAQATIEALTRWDYSDDAHKDRIDALRYALWSISMRSPRIMARSPTLRYR